jgi:hypothetical protein
MRPAPKILLFATLRWPIAGRLAIALLQLGCEVDALCPRGNPVALIKGIGRVFRHPGLRWQAGLLRALAACPADLILPCDDDAAVALSELHDSLSGSDAGTRRIQQLIRRSLGTPSACTFATHRTRLMALARDAGIRIPETRDLGDGAALGDWMQRQGYPAVVKLDQTWGGLGVSMIRGAEDLARISAAGLRPALGKSLFRAVQERDLCAWLRGLGHPPRQRTLQAFIAGSPANRAVACWEGMVLAGISVEAVTTLHATGPATVVRVIENQEMSQAAERLVRRLGLSGLWGFDFILEEGTGHAYLIEANPRATPVCHLPLGPGHDLPAALLSRVREEVVTQVRPQIRSDLIAMFPGEWQRDPASPHLLGTHHDVPWDQADFLKDCLERPWAMRGLLARVREWLRPRASRKPTGTARTPGVPNCTDAAVRS